MSTPPRVCIHGALRRQCEACQLADDLEVMTAERDALRQRAWSAEAQLSMRVALRREIEAILGIESGPASDEQLEAGVAAARALLAERDVFRAALVRIASAGTAESGWWVDVAREALEPR